MINLVSFVDELVKVGAMDPLYKRADDGEINTVDIPHGMMSHDPMPDSIKLHPDDATTRLPNVVPSSSLVTSGMLGGVTSPRDPIDREKFNRAYRDRR